MCNELLDRISTIVDDEIISSFGQKGGCIAASQVLTTSSGKKYFVKSGFSNGMFKCEANGLREIQQSSSIQTPKVVGLDIDFLVLEHIEHGLKTKEAMYNFGREFAKMHQYSSSLYGFYENNFIGSNTQINETSERWDDFYLTNRLKYQYLLAEENGYTNSVLTDKFIRLECILHKILEGSEEKPSLLHGDLWGGNYLINDEGKAVLIDPAVYYGHREADLAMTKLFGGFSEEFYQAYEANYPRKEGWEYRENVYLLYHVFNHLNLFGKSYYAQAIDLIDFYI